MLTDPGANLTDRNDRWLARLAAWGSARTQEQEDAELVQAMKDWFRQLPQARREVLRAKIRNKAQNQGLTKEEVIAKAVQWLRNKELMETLSWL